MNRRRMNEEAIEKSITKHPKVIELLKILDEVDDFTNHEEDGRSYRLPYSSNPPPIGERWKSA